MLPVGFETTISASKRPQTYALDRAAAGIGLAGLLWYKYIWSTMFITILLSFLVYFNISLKYANKYFFNLWN